MAKRAGFTLLELLMTIGIISIIAATSIPTYAAVQRRLIVNQSAAELTDVLQAARTKAMSTGGNVLVTVTASSVTQSNDVTGLTTTWNAPGGIALSPTVFTFTRLTGLAANTTVIVTGAQSYSRNIEVAANGKISLP